MCGLGTLFLISLTGLLLWLIYQVGRHIIYRTMPLAILSNKIFNTRFVLFRIRKSYGIDEWELRRVVKIGSATFLIGGLGLQEVELTDEESNDIKEIA